MTKALHEKALEYTKRGFSVIPLKPHDKKPLGPWREYQDRHATEEDFDEWFADGKNNIGIVTGRISGLAVVDFDTEEAIKLAKAQNFPKTPLVKTGKGYHAYCRYRDGVRNFQKRDDLPGIDLRGDGGYVVAPPSIHESGVVYSWVKGRSLDDLPLAELPEWLLATKTEHKATVDELFSGGVERGGRNDALARLAGSVISRGDSLEDALDFCQTWNATRCNPPLTEQEVTTTVKSIYAAHIRNNGATEPVAWEEPLLFGEIETPELTPDLFPGWLQDYCKAIIASSQTPPGLAVMLALSVLAACLQKRFEVAPYGDDYREPLSLWTVTALEPGNRKTAIKNALTFPLSVWENEQEERHRPRTREIESKRDVLQKRIADLTTKAAKQDDRAERDKILAEVNQLKAELPEEIKPPRVWTDDVTPERLQGVLAENGERIALLSDEGGIFEIMAGLYNNGRVNLNIFLQGHAGSEARAERQGRIVRLANPCLTFGLAVQPEVISDLARGDKKRFRGNGTLARFLYCIPQSTIGNRDVTRRATIPETLKATYQAEITRLLDIEPVYDEQGTERARILAFDTEARQTWLQFSQFIESNMGNNGELRSIQDWASKLPGAVARIAGLLHVAKHGPTSPSIDNSTITAAIDLATNLVNHALAAFDLMGNDQSTNDAKTVFRWILEKRLEHFRQRDCQRAFRALDPKRMEQAAKVLYDRHIISEPIKRGGGSTGGRPSIMYTVNPAIFDSQV